MARCLIIGCGCRGRSLAAALQAAGHVVRGTTRQESALAALEAAAIEPVLADPDRLATLAPALDHVGVVCILLGSATGTPELLEALHGPRLEALLHRMLDTTVHGVVYEAAGSVDPKLLGEGAATVSRLCQHSVIPFALIERRPADGDDGWVRAAVAAVNAVLS